MFFVFGFAPESSGSLDGKFYVSGTTGDVSEHDAVDHAAGGRDSGGLQGDEALGNQAGPFRQRSGGSVRLDSCFHNHIGNCAAGIRVADFLVGACRLTANSLRIAA